MKKYILLSIFAAILAPLWGQEFLPSVIAVSGPTTDARYPAVFAVDGDSSSSWRLASGAVSGTLELRWTVPVRVDGIQWSGFLPEGSAARLWYLQSGAWKPFLAGVLGGNGGWEDLSLDQAVTTALQLRVSGPLSGQTRLEDLKIAGLPVSQISTRLSPQKISASENTRWFSDEENLFDGDTRTAWRVEGIFQDDFDSFVVRDRRQKQYPGNRYKNPWGEGSAVAELAQNTVLDLVKVYLSSPLETNLEVESASGSGWNRIGLLAKGTKAGWQRIPIANVITGKVRLKANLGWTDSVEVGEWEVWGRGAVLRDAAPLLVSEPVELAAPVNLSFESDGRTPVEILASVRGTSQPALQATLNGTSVPFALKNILRGRSIYRLAADQLWTGTNFLRIAPQAGTLEDIQIAGVPNLGLMAKGPGNWGDGLLFTNAGSLDGPTVLNWPGAQLERLEVLARDPVSVQASVKIGDAWSLLMPLMLRPGVIGFDGAGINTQAVRFDLIGQAGELNVWGSPVTSEKPRIRLLYPQEGADLSSADLSDVLSFWVSDPQAAVKVNGLSPSRRGNFFWIKVRDLNLADGVENILKITAVDALGRLGAMTVHLGLEKSRLVTLDQPEALAYTADAAFVLSGKVGEGMTVAVNGATVPVVSRRFSTTVALNEGLNLLNVTVQDKKGTRTASLVRRVVRSGQGPTLVVDAPDQMRFSKPTIDVSGRVSGTGDLAVTVNGKKAAVFAGTFLFKALALAEGGNTILVSARDGLGRTASQTLTVIRDTVAPVVTVLSPASGGLLNTTLVTVSAAVADAGRVWVKIGTGAWLPVAEGGITASVSVAEGRNTLTIEAMDEAGNQSSRSVAFTADASPPQAFDLGGVPTGWTSNPTPVLTFATTDAVSGLDHYELSIDGGAAVRAVSPFTVPSLGEGGHTFLLTAFDRAGWTSSAVSAISIDTVPPAAVTGMDIIPGTDRLTVSWKGTGAVPETYRVERNPAWPEGLKSVGTPGLVDEIGNSATAYSYRVWAVDRAGNHGPKTDWVTGLAGIESAIIEASAETIANFDNVSVVLPPGSVEAGVNSVTISELPQGSGDTPLENAVTPVYQFRVTRVAEGQLLLSEHAEFSQPVTIEIAYRPESIPEGLTEGDLQPVYYDSLWNQWVPFDNAFVDPLTHVVRFETTHFTDIAVQATAARDLAPQQLRDGVVSPLGTPMSHGPVQVSTQGGTVSTQFTEFLLPGRNGLDLALQRVYSSTTAIADAAPGAALDGERPWKLATGWRLNFPYLKWSRDGLWAKGLDGQMLSFAQSSVAESNTADGNHAVTLVNHEGSDLTLRALFKAVTVPVGSVMVVYNNDPKEFWGQPRTNYTLLSASLVGKDGRKVVFDALGRVISIEDPGKLNSIGFDYSDATKTLITDSQGRVVTVSYDSRKLVSGLVVSSPTGESSAAVTYLADDKKNLLNATDAGGRLWVYGYETQTTTTTVKLRNPPSNTEPPYKDPPADSQTAWLLNKASGPGLGQVSVTYGKQAFQYTERSEVKANSWSMTDLYFFDVRQERLVPATLTVGLDAATVLRTTSYQFAYAEGWGHQYYNAQTSVNDGRTTTVTDFGQVTKDRQKLNAQYGGTAATFYTSSGTKEVVPYARKIVVQKSPAEVLETQTLDWYFDTLRLKSTLTMRESNYVQTAFEYDVWGNPTKILRDSSGGGSRTQTKELRSYYGSVAPSDLSDGKILPLPLQAQWTPSYVVPPVVFYSQGTNSRAVLVGSLGTFYETDIKDRVAARLVTHSFWKRKAPGAVGAEYVLTLDPDAASDPALEYESFGYNTNGSLLTAYKRVDGNDAATSYSYDRWGRVMTVINPRQGTTRYNYLIPDAGHPRDDIIVTTRVGVKASDGTTNDIPTVNAYRRLTGTPTWTQDARGYFTTWTYDQLGRITSAIDPLDTDNPTLDLPPSARPGNPVTTVEYDDLTLVSKVTKPNGLVVTYDFDQAGRLKSVTKAGDGDSIVTDLSYDGYDQVELVRGPRSQKEISTRSLSKLTTKFEYDERGRVTKVIDPEFGTSKSSTYNDRNFTTTTTDEEDRVSTQAVDWSGRVVSRTLDPAGLALKSEAEYDGAGRPAVATDAEKNTTLVTYNNWGLPARIEAPSRSVFENKADGTEIPVTTRTYDMAGNLTAVTLDQPGAEDSTTEYETNAFGQLLRTRSPVTVDGVAKLLVVRFLYDRDGHKVSEASSYTNADGSGGDFTTPKTWTYDSHGRVKTATDEDGVTITYDYDSVGNRTLVQDPRNAAGRFRLDLKYDAFSRLTEATLPSADSAELPRILFEYNGAGNLTKRTEPDGQITSYGYDLRNLITTETVTNGTTAYKTTYSYDRSGLVTDVFAPSLRKDAVTYDAAGRVLTSGNSVAGITRFEYDKNGNRSRVIDGRNNATTYTYSPDGQITSVTDALNETSLRKLNRWGQVTRTVDPEQNARDYTYDRIGRLIGETTPWKAGLSIRYNAQGLPVNQIDGNGTTFDRHFSPGGRLLDETAVRGSLSNTRSYTYDEAGDLKTAVDGLVATAYNLAGGVYRPDPYGQTTQKQTSVAGQTLAMAYAYDTQQRLTKVTNPDQSVVSYTYNKLGQLKTMPNWISESIVYNAPGDAGAGLVDSFKLSNQVIRQFTYDTQDRPTGLSDTAPAGSAQTLVASYSFGYDKAGNIVQKNDNVYNYDAVNRLIGADERGWFQKKPDEVQATYGRAELDFKGVKVVTFNVTGSQSIKLDRNARSVGVDLGATYGVNKIELHPSNAVHRVKQEDLTIWASQTNTEDYVKITGWSYQKLGDGTIVLSFPVIFEARYLKVKTLWDDRDLANISLDKATFLNTAKELVKVWTLTKAHIEAYEYDEAGSRSKLTLDGAAKSYQYYPNDQGGNLTWLRTDGLWYYQYDGNGNLVTKAKALLGSTNTSAVDTAKEYWKYRWDLYNRLSSVEHNGAVVVDYIYDADNLRVARTRGSETTVYAYGRGGAITYQKNLATGTARTYAYLADQIIGWTDTAANGTTTKYWATTDQVGSVTAITDSTAKVVWSSEYTPFGKVAGAEGGYDFDGSYAGHQPDADTGLVYMWNRWQDPETGRFISEDPARDGGNWYGYAASNPESRKDKTGLYSVYLHGGSAGTTGNKGTGWEAMNTYMLAIERVMPEGGGFDAPDLQYRNNPQEASLLDHNPSQGVQYLEQQPWDRNGDNKLVAFSTGADAAIKFVLKSDVRFNLLVLDAGDVALLSPEKIQQIAEKTEYLVFVSHKDDPMGWLTKSWFGNRKLNGEDDTDKLIQTIVNQTNTKLVTVDNGHSSSNPWPVADAVSDMIRSSVNQAAALEAAARAKAQKSSSSSSSPLVDTPLPSLDIIGFKRMGI